MAALLRESNIPSLNGMVAPVLTAPLIIVALRVHSPLNLGVFQVPSRCLQVWIVVRIRPTYFTFCHIT